MAVFQAKKLVCSLAISSWAFVLWLSRRTRRTASNGNRYLCIILLIFAGCAPQWNGEIVYLENGRMLIHSDGIIKPGYNLLIYREETVSHPISGEELGKVRDEIAKANVVYTGKRFIVAESEEPWFSMMKKVDKATPARGSVKQKIGSIEEIGRIYDIDPDNKTATIINTSGQELRSGEILDVVKYTKAINEDGILAVVAESAGKLRIRESLESGSPDQVHADYELADEKLGWIEIDDVVIRRTGDMLSEAFWFQDTPAGFSTDWIFHRNYLRAIRQYEAGQYREALLELGNVMQLGPEYKDAYYIQGLCYMNLNRYEEAISTFSNMLKQKNDPKVWTSLAYTYLRQNNLQEAIRCYDSLTILMPQNPEVWMDMGDIYRKIGDVQKASQAYGKALEIDKNLGELLHESKIDDLR